MAANMTRDKISTLCALDRLNRPFSLQTCSQYNNAQIPFSFHTGIVHVGSESHCHGLFSDQLSHMLGNKKRTDCPDGGTKTTVHLGTQQLNLK